MRIPHAILDSGQDLNFRFDIQTQASWRVKKLGPLTTLVPPSYLYLTTGFLGKEAWRPTPKWNNRVFFCIFQKNTAMATLALMEMEKILWEGREKGLPCWLS